MSSLKKKSPPKSPKKTSSIALIGELRSLITRARQAVVRQVDTIQVLTNYEIGRMIVEHEQAGDVRAQYGKDTLRIVSTSLTKEFGRGFALSSLKLMRVFYLQNQERISQSLIGLSDENKKSQSVIGLFPLQNKPFFESFIKLSWTHHICLMGISDPAERSFYEIEAAKQSWTVRELDRQISSALYERLALSRNKKKVLELSRKGQVIEKPEDAIKSPLVLEFLGLDEKAAYSETKLESAIIGKMEAFLLELGHGFSFVARQKRFNFDEDNFFVDLVFYNRLLKCHVLVDLKLGKLSHQDLGQMQMYVNYFDRKVKIKDENPTIGIVLCKRKKDSLIEMTLPKNAKIFSSQYQMYLPSKALLKRQLETAARESEQALARAARFEKLPKK